MPPSRTKQREANRERQARFRAKRRSEGFEEIRTLLPKSIVSEIDVAVLFVAGGSKEALIRLAIENYLEKHVKETGQYTQLIKAYWGEILRYKITSPALLRPGQTVVVKGRTYTFEESVKLAEIRATIVRFFKARGIPHPEEAITSLHLNHFSGK